MIARLTGNLAEKDPNLVLIDVGGVGYRVTVPVSTYYALPGRGDDCRLLIYTHVGADVLALYGFATAREQTLFELLIGVSRIGPKLAINIMSGIQPADLAQALAQGDTARLMAIPGVGKKAAERMVVELKDKAAKLAGEIGFIPDGGPVVGALGEDAASALIHLGYNRGQAEKAVTEAMKTVGEDADLEDLLKAALKRLAK